MTEHNPLAERCARIADLSREALDWIADPENAATVETRDAKSMSRLLRRGARRAEKLARAARTNMSVSVFGPSQAGKSFLVSVLARPEGGRLVADFGPQGGKRDYIREINPEGEGESTGLVTRFTMTKAPTPDGYPIQLTLLSEADLARTLINSFFMDGDQSEPPPDADGLAAHFAAFQSKAGVERPGMGIEDVLEIAEYIEGTFARSAYAAALKPFWDDASMLAPRLEATDRAAFLSILWGGHQAFTDLYVQLATSLAQIDHADEVYAAIDALIPRDASIIDVKTLHGLFDGQADTLRLRTAAGKETALPRAVVTALAAELVFPMETQPSPIFAQTDLLDFPGARNRFEQPLAKTLSKPEETLTQLLLRGKVAYLFDRYVENQEITSMLLCVPDSNMETLDLPGLVANWIALTHGARPEQRTDTDCILFFVMTKFDKHLGESAAGGGESTRFDRRMDASLLQGFGGKIDDSWVNQWTPHQPFQNCYWLRNPNYFVEGLIEYDDAQRELQIRPDKEERLSQLRDGCLAADSVQRHFKDPARAWDAALALNDGGVGYLTDELTKVCKPASKMRQIGAQADRIVRDVVAELGSMHVSDDIEQRIEDKRIAAAAIIDGLELTLQNHRFGAFLEALCVDQDLIQDRISRVPSSIRISSAVSGTRPTPPTASAPSARPPRPGRPARPDRPAPAAAAAPTPDPAATVDASPAGIRTMTAETFQTETAIEVWVEALEAFRADESRLSHFGISPDAATDLVAEMIHGLKRTGTPETMHEVLKQIGYGLTVDKQAPPAALVCSERINTFVCTLNAAAMAPAERPRVDLGDGVSRDVFEPRPDHDSAEGLPVEPRPVAADTWTDWVYALDALVVGNAKDGDAGAVNVEQNLRLGGILGGLQGREAAE